MGNCLKSSEQADDNSHNCLLQENENGNNEIRTQQAPPPYQVSAGQWQSGITGRLPVYHIAPNISRHVSQLTEEEQIKIAQRIGLMQRLPMVYYDESEKKARECIICMIDFEAGQPIKLLPCFHIYHIDCIDDWLMRSFTCPSCMEPVDTALLNTFQQGSLDFLSHTSVIATNCNNGDSDNHRNRTVAPKFERTCQPSTHPQTDVGQSTSNHGNRIDIPEAGQTSSRQEQTPLDTSPASRLPLL